MQFLHIQKRKTKYKVNDFKRSIKILLMNSNTCIKLIIYYSNTSQNSCLAKIFGTKADEIYFYAFPASCVF